jgi:hypothetical protein
MEKQLAKVVLNTIGSRYGSIDALNANFEAIEAAFQNTVSRDGEGPNALEANLDAGSFRIINLPAPVGASDAATKGYVDIATAALELYLEQIDIVAENIESVVAVADNVEALVGLSENAAILAENLEAVQTVSDNIGSVEIVGLELNGAFQQGVVYDFGEITDPAVGEVEETTSSIVIVANNITNVNLVGGSIDNINAVAGDLANIDTVLDNIANIDIVAAIDTEVTAVAVVASDIETLSPIAANITAVAANATNINLVAAIDSDVTAVAAIDDNVTTVATNIADVNTVASNIVDVQNAEEHADAAIAAKVAAEAARDAALAALDSFDDRYLGQKATAPTVDNDGDALVTGALYFNTVDDIMYVWDGTTWLAAYASLSGALLAANNLSDLTNALSARNNLGLGSAATTDSTAYATATQGGNADTAFGWGDHALAGYAIASALGDLAVLDTVDTDQIDDGAVTSAKLATTLDLGTIA